MFSTNHKIALVITAAGKSSRMGYPKGLYLYEDQPLLKHHIKNFEAAFPEAPILLVLGHHVDEYQKLIQEINSPRLEICVNLQYEQGQFSSIKKGVETASKFGIKGIFLQPIDLEPIPPALYAQMLQVSPGKLVVKPRFEGKTGHPIFLQNDILKVINNSSNGDRLDLILRGLDKQFIAWYDCNTDKILTNINGNLSSIK